MSFRYDWFQITQFYESLFSAFLNPQERIAINN